MMATDLSQLSDEELQSLAAQHGVATPSQIPDLSAMSDEELASMAQQYGVGRRKLQPPVNAPGFAETASTSLLNGLTFGHADELAAAGATAVKQARQMYDKGDLPTFDNLLKYAPDVAKTYQEMLPLARDRMNAGQEANPKTAAAHDILGTIGSGYGALAGMGMAAPKLAQFAANNPKWATAIGGGLSGAARSVGDAEGGLLPDGSALETARYGLIGAAGGLGGYALGKGLSALSGAAGRGTDKVMKKILPEKSSAGSSATTSESAATNSIPMPMTGGQRTGDAALLQKEQEALRGNLGTEARQVAEQKVIEQNNSYRSLIDKMAGRIETGRDINSIVDNIAGTIRNNSDTAREQIGSAFDIARTSSSGVKISTDHIQQGLWKNIANIRREAQYDISQLPQAKSVLSRLARYSKKSADNGTTITAVQLGELENFRRQATNAIASTQDKTEKRFLGQIVRQYDDFMQNTAKNAVAKGDADAIMAFREAVSKRAEFGRLFEKNDLVAKLNDKQLTVDDARNLLKGTGAIKGKKEMANNFDAILAASKEQAPSVHADMKAVFMQDVLEKSYSGKNMPNNPEIPDISPAKLAKNLKELFVDQSEFAGRLYGDETVNTAKIAIKELEQIKGGINRVWNPGSGTPIMQLLNGAIGLAERAPAIGTPISVGKKIVSIRTQANQSREAMSSIRDEIAKRAKTPTATVWAGSISGSSAAQTIPTITIRKKDTEKQ